MSVYSLAIIYFIRCNTTSKMYVGSTIQSLKVRISKHETDFKGYYGFNEKPRAYRSSFDCMENDDYEMIKIEDYPCNNVKELEERETLHILKCRSLGYECTNKQIPRTIKNPDWSSLPDLS